MHRAASLLGRPAAPHPRVPPGAGIHPVASRASGSPPPARSPTGSTPTICRRSRRTSRRGRRPMVEYVPSNTPPVGERRAPGMDHAHHPFRTLPEAPRFAWPDGARIAFTVTLVLDYWELEPPRGRQPRSTYRLAIGEILSRLADLEPARIRRARRHLPCAGRAGPVRRDAQRGAGFGGGAALSGAGGRADAPQRLLPGARQPTPRGGSPAA